MDDIQGRNAITMATSNTIKEYDVKHFNTLYDVMLPMIGMTVQAVNVLLATAMMDNSSSNRDTSPSSRSFSA